jgi:hypothetical protein
MLNPYGSGSLLLLLGDKQLLMGREDVTTLKVTTAGKQIED